MQSNLILTTSQAQAVYNAMVGLSAISGFAKRIRIAADLAVGQNDFGAVIVDCDDTARRERHDDLAAFAAAYGLRAAPDASDLLAALQTAHMALTGYLPAHRNAVIDAAIETCRATISRNAT